MRLARHATIKKVDCRCGDCLHWVGCDLTLRSLVTDILYEIGARSLALVTADDALTYVLQNTFHCPLVIVDQALPRQIQEMEYIKLIQSRLPWIASILTSGYLIDPSDLRVHTIYLHEPWFFDDWVISVATLLQPGIPISRT